ncbi:MAG: hypothetical protein JXA42_11145 [Anaerolineales bacterium]|nr:hypothetical protein [Anaerolineales bacterium]
MLPEQLLPKKIIDKASLSGKEYAWRQSDVETMILAAKQAGLATIGGQTQFQIPKGTIELYWLEFYSMLKKEEETWESYVKRSAQECLDQFKNLCKTTDFVKEGLESNFKQIFVETENISSYLCFVFYFDTEESYKKNLELFAGQSKTNL